MKSAIFLELGGPSRSKGFRRSFPLKKAKSMLPYSPSVGTQNSPLPSTPTSAPKSSPWNVDEMISLYIALGLLPRLLSPNLPPQFAKSDFLDIYNDAADKENETLHREEDPAKLPHGSDIDNLPISLLSPTLPTMFEPKEPSALSKSPKKGSKRVRWINKLHDPKRPRFLVRITIPSLALKSATPKLALKGLGISQIDGPTSPAMATHSDAASHWRKAAKGVMTNAENVKSQDPLLSVVVQFDWILCLVIATDYESKQSRSHVHAERVWNSVLIEIPPFVSRIEDYIKTYNVQDKKKAYLTLLVGVLTTLKALVVKRINHSLLSAEPLQTSSGKAVEIQRLIIENYQSITDILADAQSFFMRCPSPSTVFPKSWHNRSTPVQKTKTDLPLYPATDKYYAPIGSYSDVRDACGYLYCCLREFMELYGLEMNEGAKYSFQSGKKYST